MQAFTGDHCTAPKNKLDGKMRFRTLINGIQSNVIYWVSERYLKTNIFITNV